MARPLALGWIAGAAWLAAGPSAAAVALPEAPLPGAYEAQLCVAVAQAAPDCGPVAFDLSPGGQAVLRVHDIVYRLQLRGADLDVFLFHGAMQIDEFTTSYRWLGGALHFSDDAKGARYELRLGLRKPPE